MGCGPGAMLVTLAEVVGPDGHVVGVDADEQAVQAAHAVLAAADVTNAAVRPGRAEDTGAVNTAPPRAGPCAPSRPERSTHGGRCRKRPGCPDRAPMPSPSTAADTSPPHPTPDGPAGTHPTLPRAHAAHGNFARKLPGVAPAQRIRPLPQGTGGADVTRWADRYPPMPLPPPTPSTCTASLRAI
ncbi:MAG: methyltransferase domain-containing protein [Pseudonocardiaceae bacterium]